ncbi:MAG: hypothetical protein ACP5US_10890 [Candidatus Kryptoniota bacterium]
MKNSTSNKKLIKILAFLPFLIITAGCNLLNGEKSEFSTQPVEEQLAITDEEARQIVNEAMDDFEFTQNLIATSTQIGKRSPDAVSGLRPVINLIIPAGGDTTFVHGDTMTIGSDLYGVVVTERHQHPKGLLLITKAIKYGYADGIVSRTQRFISWTQYNSHMPETETFSYIRPDGDKILAEVTRNKGTATLSHMFTFTSPIVTVNTSANTKTVRSPGDPVSGKSTIATSTYDLSTGYILNRRLTFHDEGILPSYPGAPPFGAFATRTETYQNNTLTKWTETATLGFADHSVYRVISTWP